MLAAVFLTLSTLPALPVQIPDSALEIAIRETLGKPVGEITQADMESLTSLSISDLNIADLTGLEAAVNLTTLILSNNQINDISVLSGLTRLTALSLSNNQISDFSALSGLTFLNQLWLENNQISDISTLSGFTILTRLYLGNNQISNISALSGLTFLDQLGLENNQISNISALSGLTRLRWLWLENNQISDISALSGLEQLALLWLHNNHITDIGALAGLINLQDDFLFDGLGLRLQENFIDVTPGSSQRQIIDNLNAIDGLTVEFEPQNLDIFQGQTIGDFPGWKASPWYMNYNVDFWPWIFHDEHDWQFVDSGSTTEVIFVWDLGLGEWLFFNENTYRWVFLFGDNSGWIFTFGDNTPNRRYFQRSDDGSLFSVPVGLPVD